MSTKTALKSRMISSPVAKSSPFQATKLWNQMIRNFREGIDLKKRRWKMKSYENTFCGHDAVDWFHLYLKSNQKFGDHVTRAQAKMLLQKFFENGIFEDARGKEKRHFEDDSHLYRFTNKTDNICKNKTEIASQRSITNLLRSVSVRRRPTSMAEAGEGERKSGEMKKGAVTRSQSLKNACMSPKKTLIQTGSSKLTPIHHSEDSNVMIKSDEKEFRENPVDIEFTNSNSQPASYEEERGIDQPVFDLSDEATYNSILQDAGIDNRAFVVADMSPFEMPFQRTFSLRGQQSMKYRHKFVVQCDEEDLIHEPSFVINKSIQRAKLKRTKSSKFVTGISYTKGGQCQSPSKKPKVDSDVKESSRNSTVGTTAKENLEEPVNGAIPGSYLFERRKSLRHSVKSDTSLCQMNLKTPKCSNIAVHNDSAVSNFWKARTLQGLKQLLNSETLDDYVNLSIISDHETENNIKMELKSADIPEWTLSAMKYLVDWPNSRMKENDDNLPSYEGFECDVFRAIQDHYDSTLKEPLMTYNMFKLFEACAEFIVNDRQVAIQLFQHICLLIPTWNRKQIYLIVRFMDRIAKNLSLRLSKDLPNRELVIRSFYRTIVRNKEMNHVEKDQMTSIRAVTFLIDHHEKIMAVPKELQELKKSFEELRLGKENVPVATQKPSSHIEPIRRPVSVCVQYQREEFEKQAVDCTRQALTDLLNMIVNDDTLHPKIKKKRLKEFKKNYPEIYQVKFPEDNISTCSTTSQKTLRIRQTIRPFFFMKRNSEF